MSPAEYGELTLYFIFMGVAQTFFSYGLDIAYLRYFTLEKDAESRRHITGTTLCTSLITSATLAFIIIGFAGEIGHVLIKNPVHQEIVPAMIRICAGILFFDTLTLFPFLLLRGTHRPVSFTLVKVINVSINIGLNIWFVGSLRLSVAGVLWANLAASAVTLIIVIPDLVKNGALIIERSVLKEMVRFGLPNIPTYLFVMIVELADRKIIEIYRGLEEAGIYSAGYKLGMFMAVVTAAFRFAWQPFFLSHAEDENAPRLFARVLTYYLLVTGFLLVALTFFVELIIKTEWPRVGYILDQRYWAGLAVFPIILLAHIFDGVYANLMVGVYLKKLTRRLPFVTGAAAVFTIAFNLLLVPSYGMIAAAWITFLAFFLQALLLWLVVRNSYNVPYEWIRMLKLVMVGGLILGLGFVPQLSAWWSRGILCLLFPVALYLVGFFDKTETLYMRKAFSRG
jgi:O-antigen/teichoic acid export membrane protein